MPSNSARKHHYVPQFYLRNFALDQERKKVTTVAKQGAYAIWQKRSIKNMGYEVDFYVHMKHGVPVSVESSVNLHIETPISRSNTWKKIVEGRTEDLTRADKPILYALIRHLETRTPHYLNTLKNLAKMANDGSTDIPFTNLEVEHYTNLLSQTGAINELFNHRVASLDWTEASFKGSSLSIFRTPIRMRSSSNPVIALRAPTHPKLTLPLPGMVPYYLILPLNPYTLASLAIGDFDDAFQNIEITSGEAASFNRQILGHFAHFSHVRHLITDREKLTTDMTWAPFDLIKETETKITFKQVD